MTIAKQLSGSKSLSLIKNKNYSQGKMNFFLCSKRKNAVKPTINQNSAVSIALLEKFKIAGHKFWSWILGITVFLADIGYFVKLLSSH